MRRPPVTDAFIAAAPSGEILFWGRGAEQTFGYLSAEMVGQPLSSVVRLPRLRSGGTFRVDARRKGGETFRAGVVVEPFEAMISIVIRDESRWGVVGEFADVVMQHPDFATAAPRVAELLARAFAFEAVAIWNTEDDEPRRAGWWSASRSEARESGLLERVRRSGERANSATAMLFPIADRAHVFGVIELFCVPGKKYGQPVTDDLARIAALASRFISRERFRGAHELSNGAVFSGVHGSDELYRMLGVKPRSQPLSLRWFMRHVVPEDRERLREAIGAARRQGSLDVQLRMRRDDGDTRHLRVQARLNGSRPIGNVTDLTSELREARRLTGLGQLAATMAHEFKNVLMGISTFTEILRRRTAGEVHVQNAVAQIQQSLGRGRRITDEVLRFTREQAPPTLTTIDVGRWLHDFLPEAAALSGDRAKLEVEDELFIRGDIALLNQALANLIINARDAAPEGPIGITARRAGEECVELIVSDRGSGIAADLRDRIFEPLFTTKRGGTGLGLPVVQQVVAAHGGSVEVESEPGRGSRFHLRLPLARESAAAEPPSLERVLLVEDDPAVTLALCAILEAEEIGVRTATSGAAAIAAIERQLPQVVLLDIGLPDVSGADVYGEIAARWPSLPVVFITAELDDTKVARFLRRPHIGFLRKPFEAEQLLDTLSRITSVKIRSNSGRIPASGRQPGSQRSK